MKFVTECEHDINWMSDPERFDNIKDEVGMIKDAGLWDSFLSMHQDENGYVDCDMLYEYLWHEGNEALLDVGLHRVEATATVDDVLDAWEEKNAPLKVDRVNCPGKENHEDPTGLEIYSLDNGDSYIYFESIDEDGNVESNSLDNDDVFDLLEKRIPGANNANTGEWDSHDPKTAIFEMWRGRL